MKTEHDLFAPARVVMALLVLSLLLHSAAQAAECPAPSLFAPGATLNVRIDNDLFGGVGQDQGYSNGFLVTAVSPNLVSYHHDPCLPAIVRLLNRYLDWLQPEGFDAQNMTLGLGQTLYTPTDRTQTGLIVDDRPYTAAVLLSTGYNVRRGDDLRTSQIRLGIVGPSARGEQVQNGWHNIIGVDHFDGWRNQLRDEPVIQLVHERRRRVASHGKADGWGGGVVGHWGGSLGNFATYANAGAEWRWGYRVPNDFGSAPLGPAGENTSPMPAAEEGRAAWSGHFFIALDARWVLHDITLDGNTFKTSHSVDKRPLVADVGTGLTMTRGAWRFAFTHYFRTQEFKGQRHNPVYGNFTISHRF